ncbi:MAG: glycine zipper 2TM domain-containing protein, partial [Burkholderiaceae bacterium]
MNTLTLTQSSLLLTLSALASAAGAQELGRVISSTPVVQQFAVPRQVCNTAATTVASPKSGGGAVLGAIAGGVVGNQLGRGSGNALATAIGLFGGAVLGDRIEGSNGTEVQNVTQCTTQTFYENRPVAYNVVYEFSGKQYQVQLPQDPGPTIQLQVTPVGNSRPYS